jgi:hypothetical protein
MRNSIREKKRFLDCEGYIRWALRLSRIVNVSTITPIQLESVMVKAIPRRLTRSGVSSYAFAKLHPVQTVE